MEQAAPVSARLPFHFSRLVCSDIASAEGVQVKINIYPAASDFEKSLCCYAILKMHSNIGCINNDSFARCFQELLKK